MNQPTATGRSLACPVCSGAMTEFSREGINVDLCTAGCGTWLDGDEVQKALHATELDQPPAAEDAAIASQTSIEAARLEAPTRACPFCKQTMKVLVFAYDSGVVIDRCDEHGVWCDKAELERLEAWFEGSQARKHADVEQWRHQMLDIEDEFDRRAVDESARVHVGPIAWMVRRSRTFV
jgi:Zn-finger nucleic acid-binding protein